MKPGDFVRDRAQLRGIILNLDRVRPEGSDLNAGYTVPVARVAWANDSTTWIETKYLTVYEMPKEDLVSTKLSKSMSASAGRSQYPRWLIVAFVTSAGVLMVAIIGLILSPFFASPDIVTLLLACAALGSGGLFLVVRRAEKATNP